MATTCDNVAHHPCSSGLQLLQEIIQMTRNVPFDHLHQETKRHRNTILLSSFLAGLLWIPTSRSSFCSSKQQIQVAIGGDLIHSHLLERARWKMGRKNNKKTMDDLTMKFRAKPHVQTGSRILDESFLRCAPPHLHVAWVDNHLPGKGFGTRALDHSWQRKPDWIGLGLQCDHPTLRLSQVDSV